MLSKDQAEIKYGNKLLKARSDKLDKQYGEALFVGNQLYNAVRDAIKETPLRIHAPVKMARKVRRSKRTLIASLSDTHYGSNICKEEMHQMNEYNWQIASRRTAFFVEQIVHFKEHHRDDTDLVLQINGDIIAGLIHNTEWFADLLTIQHVGSLSILTQAISYLARHFNKMQVVCLPGNHGRSVGKADKGRATTHKWDSYETMLYYSLKLCLPHIDFKITESPFLIYPVQGHLVCQSHGDTVFKPGNPGKSINMKSLDEQVKSLNSEKTLVGKGKVDILSLGHVHVATVQGLQSGCTAVINGCLSGTDPFAQSIGIFANNPTQIVLECTEKYPVGDIRMVKVKEADTDKRLDAIITPFMGRL
jgi:predicted phosphodiesterase